MHSDLTGAGAFAILAFYIASKEIRGFDRSFLTTVELGVAFALASNLRFLSDLELFHLDF
jgi:hypothetical protein